MKKVLAIQSAPPRHWVGDGFPVHGLFAYNGAGVAERSPFLLLDYAAPYEFSPKPSGPPRGVGQHPHRGFETVTMVFSGELAHHDSTGAGGLIGPGDVQWMTAGGGIIHEEYHSPAYSAAGGTYEVAQLWVNLPAAQKMHPARYQHISAADIPHIALPHGAGEVRLIAGEWQGERGPAQTFSPMRVAHVLLQPHAVLDLPQPEGWSSLLLLRHGTAQVQGQAMQAAQWATLSQRGQGIRLEAGAEGAQLLFMAGQPLDEPVVGYGPFVMNSQEEILQAVEDFNSGRFLQPASQSAKPA